MTAPPFSTSPDHGARRFVGDVAFVTGAASGISRAVAVGLAREGARVACADIDGDGAADTARSITDAGGQAIALTVDVGNSAAVTSGIEQTVATWGTLSVLINGAGLLRFTPLEECTDEEWEQVVRVNLGSQFYALRAAYPHLVANGGGSVVQISSTSAKSGSSLGGPHYTAAKGGVISLTKYAARRWAKDNIRVNTVCPGITDTAMVNQPDSPRPLSQYQGDVRLGHVAQPSDIADPILFLASPDSRHMTGITMDVSGGREIYGN